ncbi:MBL fold metallo-hydrolase, partial [Faecalibaculum rodentium]
MKVICIPLGPVQANCYVIIQDGKALLIDPGDRFEDLKHILERNHATLEAVLLTHAHFDHIGGLD